MGVIKKNPLFSLIVGLGILLFIAGAVLAILQMGKSSKANKQVKSAQQQLESLIYSQPAPSDYNLEASGNNVDALRSDLEEIRDNLERGANIDASSDGVSAVASIQQFISEFSAKTQNHENEKGESDPIITPANFAFGFERYIGQVTVPENKAVIPLLDKQRQILSYLIDQLIESNPESILSIQRELVEVVVTDSSSSGPKQNSFSISSEVSAKVPNAIDTMAFSIKFSGYTQSLRLFLNSLSEFELPIVVRSVKVERIKQKEGVQSAPRPRTIDDIFGGPGAGTTTVVESVPEQKAVITENLSSFTVILEFIDIIIPAEKAKNPS
jgi:hypothetical protein